MDPDLSFVESNCSSDACVFAAWQVDVSVPLCGAGCSSSDVVGAGCQLVPASRRSSSTKLEKSGRATNSASGSGDGDNRLMRMGGVV